MPLCIARLHDVGYYCASDRLSIAVPNIPQESLPLACAGGGDIRLGRAFFIHPASKQAEDLDGAAFCNRCCLFRNSQAVSFIGCSLTDTIRDEERSILERLSRQTDYVILDVTDLPVELWSAYIGTIRRITRRVGVYVRFSPKRPCDILAPWIAKASCELGSKGVVFIDGPVVVCSRVQDELEGHPYSGGAGRIIPVIRNIQVLDIEPFVIESRRRWCAGVCVQDGACDGRFDLWKCVCEMIGQGKGVRSMLHAFGERWVDFTIECLRLEEALQSDGSIAAHKSRVEELLLEAERKSMRMGDISELQRIAEPLLANAASQIRLKQRPFSFLR